MKENRDKWIYGYDRGMGTGGLKFIRLKIQPQVDRQEKL